MRPQMTAAAANLINAIANSASSKTSSTTTGTSSESKTTSNSTGTPPNALASSEDSSSPGDFDTRLNVAAAAGPGGVSSSDVNTTQILALAEQALTTDPIVLFTSSLYKLERADYDGCLLDLNAVLLSLLATNVQSVNLAHPNSLFHQQLQISVRYKLTCMILCHIRNLDELGTKAVQAAHLAQFVADIPVLPRHRLVLLRLALKKNLIVQNYGFAAKCLNLLIPKELPDKADLQKQLEECKTKDFRDAEPLPLGTRLCTKSFATKFITPNRSCVVCKLCRTSYHTNLISLSAPCHYCFWRGTLVQVHGTDTANNGTVTSTTPGSTVLTATSSQATMGIVISKELTP